MCEYYDRILEEGRKIGYEEGLEEGMASARIRHVRTLTESLGKEPEEVLDLLHVFGKERWACLSTLRAEDARRACKIDAHSSWLSLLAGRIKRVGRRWARV